LVIDGIILPRTYKLIKSRKFFVSDCFELKKLVFEGEISKKISTQIRSFERAANFYAGWRRKDNPTESAIRSTYSSFYSLFLKETEHHTNQTQIFDNIKFSGSKT
jgi:hypothetical protein